MKKKICFCLIALFTAIALSNCATTRQNDFSGYNLSLKDTLSIFLLNNEKGRFFCIPVQYMGDYQISRFKFEKGDIQIDDYHILLKRNDINISVYLNETANEDGNAVEGFKLIYQEINGKVLTSKMAEPRPSLKGVEPQVRGSPLEPPAVKNKPDYLMNHYYIFIEKNLSNNKMKKIVKKYESGKVYSKFSIWYDLTIDNEEQNGSGLLDDFELYNGPALDPSWFPVNLNFFKAKYLQK
jgi:hypothetical protein